MSITFISKTAKVLQEDMPAEEIFEDVQPETEPAEGTEPSAGSIPLEENIFIGKTYEIVSAAEIDALFT